MAEEQPSEGFLIRQKFIEERKKLMERVMPKRRSVRVNPRDDDMRRVLKHPSGRIGFPASGSVEWPYDKWTKKRIADGDVVEERRQ